MDQARQGRSVSEPIRLGRALPLRMRSLRHLLAVLALFGALPAWALDPGALSFVYSGAGGRALPAAISGSLAGRAFGAITATGAATVADSAVARVGGASVAMTATRSIPLTGLLTAGARILPVLSAGLLAYDLYNAIRCKPTGDGSSTGLLCDPGTGQVMSGSVYEASDGSGADRVSAQGASPSDACAALVGRLPTAYGNLKQTWSNPQAISDSQCKIHWVGYIPDTGHVVIEDNGFFQIAKLPPQLTCPTLPGGATPQPGPDGKCPSLAYQPKTHPPWK